LFDLVYVFAVTQITGYMADEHSAQGVLQGLLPRLPVTPSHPAPSSARRRSPYLCRDQEHSFAELCASLSGHSFVELVSPLAARVVSPG